MKNAQKLRLIRRYLVPGKIIDLGSFGMTDENLHEQMEEMLGRKITGVDITKGKNVDIVWDLNNDFGYEDKPLYSNVIASEVIEHVENYHHFIRECNKLLFDGGRLILSTPNSIGIPYLMGIREQKDDIIAVYMWQLVYSLEKNGFKIINVHYLNNYYNRNWLLRLFGFLAYRFRPTLFVVAEKIK